MSLFQTLSSQELAQQLRDPVGTTGLAVADALGAINQAANGSIVAGLALRPADRVLEVGCGLASMARMIIDAAEDVRYTGLDQSGTMIEEVGSRHSDLVQAGCVSFQLGRVERMPFGAGCFTKVFSVGVIHFWPDPKAALTELRRVMRPGALMVMGGLGPNRAPAFAVQEHGFYLHDTDQWRAFCETAGLSLVDVGSTRSGEGPQHIHFTARA